jgi:hypothetical protein
MKYGSTKPATRMATKIVAVRRRMVRISHAYAAGESFIVMASAIRM